MLHTRVLSGNIAYAPRGGAVWSARMAHNHQVVGSNPTPATKIIKEVSFWRVFFLFASVFDSAYGINRVWTLCLGF